MPLKARRAGTARRKKTTKKNMKNTESPRKTMGHKKHISSNFFSLFVKSGPDGQSGSKKYERAHFGSPLGALWELLGSLWGQIWAAF